MAPLKENGKMFAEIYSKSTVRVHHHKGGYLKYTLTSKKAISANAGYTVTEEGVLKLLKKLNPKKACGPDLIPAKIVKDIAEELSPLLTLIFQRP